jgi:transposase
VRNFHSGAKTLPGSLSKTGNKRLRTALFYSAMVAKKTDPYCREFADKLRRKGKKPKQIIAAIMRKYLHAFWGMFNSDTGFDSSKLFPHIHLPAA